jgi:sugar/nucleoside kinase (ribokinase family)
MGNYDVICIGDAKLDVFLKVSENNPKCRFDEAKNELCFNHGEKIVVEQTNLCVGGNAANVSIGLSRLGIKATIAAEIGDDEFSLKIINAFARENIDRAFIKQMHGQDSSISVAINYKSDRTLFTEHLKRDHEFSYEFGLFKWVYLTSLGDEWRSAYQKAIEYCQSHNAKLAFNPGSKQLAQKSILVDEALKVCEVLFVNKEEAKTLIKEYLTEVITDDTQEIINKLKSFGLKNIILTDGENGSYGMDFNNTLFHQKPYPCNIVELTGAGDAYSTGYLAATIHNLDMENAMKWGSANSASVIGKIGSQEGLLKREEMEEIINEYQRS